MGAVPNKKPTRARQGRKLAAYRLSAVYPSRCPQCRAAKRPHQACRACGYYKGRQIVEVGAPEAGT